MQKKVLITGSNGYIGNALIHALQDYGYTTFCIDNGGRTRWVKEVGGISLTNYQEHPYFAFNLQDQNDALRTLSGFLPDVIIHLASQPSAPYSEMSAMHRMHTQDNNLKMLMNLLHISKEIGISPKFIVTTTTGTPGAPDLPILEEPMPNLAGSSYHVSRGFDSANLQLAAKQYKFRILELRTSIVYGTRIYNHNYPVTRFDWDYYFGTVVHRFIFRKMMKQPVQIYGKGEQRKPFISLKDTVKSIIDSIDYDIPEGHMIMNQTTECLEIREIADYLGCRTEHIPNPRIEKEEHKMVIHNEKFMDLLNSASKLKEEIESIESDLHMDKVPKDWKDIFKGRT